ncbi:hypothetical protein N656DRAFT_716558 [Canariomyces notabilis]|uniref:Pheromone receptor n=1 Tax=Canariomyces notabilis TaxID=2074819 RepID=A0AAN6T9U8_9PEZI|nr:hypothetical protein N656DRAFT_716558 [Canariomyces arenarius]
MNTNSSTTNSSATAFDPLNQIFSILGPDGRRGIPLTPASVSAIYSDISSLSILYGTQIGASFIMLAVVLSMTPGVRLKRLPAIISISALTLNTIRMTLNALYFTSSWLNLYTVITGDTRPVLKTDYDLSATTTALSIPITILIEAALFVQAWSMLQLWKTVYKAAAVAISLALVFTTIAFNFSVTVIQTLWILYSTNFPFAIWMRQTYVGLITASICWFCFLFNIRLVMHMWQNRTILPSLKGLKAMDVLVITNGILMFVPVIFSALEFRRWVKFESASLTQTSVIVILPLGTLIAQRLANPAWFGTGSPSSAGSHGGTDTTVSSSCSPYIISGSSRSSGTAASARRPLLASAYKSSNATSNGAGHAHGHVEVHRGPPAAVLTSHIRSDGSNEKREARTQYAELGDRELARMDREDLERGVRVGYDIEQGEERVGVADEKERLGS